MISRNHRSVCRLTEVFLPVFELPFSLAHDEDIGGWSARIGDCLVRSGGSMSFCSIVEVTGLALVEVLLGLLLSDLGSLMKRSGDGDDEGFYRHDGILVERDRSLRLHQR